MNCAVPAWNNSSSYGKEPGSHRLAKDPLLLLKMCVPQDRQRLSEERTELRVLDRTIFRRFLGLSVLYKGPDGKSTVVVFECLSCSSLNQAKHPSISIYRFSSVIPSVFLNSLMLVHSRPLRPLVCTRSEPPLAFRTRPLSQVCRGFHPSR